MGWQQKFNRRFSVRISWIGLSGPPSRTVKVRLLTEAVVGGGSRPYDLVAKKLGLLWDEKVVIVGPFYNLLFTIFMEFKY